ncbi:S1C family serine protease [Pseudoduganella violaceinigra]|uniref:S1C family serine protease n=1 Tax=Pseudoduganella violaceinigra TaxID=246602 RepID=UPI00042573B9|nr:serine protease [Pseudoduganella violaceinigra]
MPLSRLLPACAGLLLAALPDAARALPADQLYARLAPSVWRVNTFDKQGKPYGQGSAVVIGRETLLTNCHVLLGSYGATVQQDNRSFGIVLQYADPDNDLCQVTAKGLDAPAVEQGDSDRLAVGSRIYALGNPRGLELTLSDGLISALRKDGKGRLAWIQISAPISPGSSGGGVFDENGRLIGISTAGYENAQNLNLARPILLAKGLAERHAAWMARADARKAAKAAASPPLPVSPAARPGLQASGYAEIDDLAKFKRVAAGAGPEAAYKRFLAAPLPRAFAISDDGQTWQTWSLAPQDQGAPREPSERAIKRCEKEYRQHCYLYAIDNTVVYRPPQ